LRDHRTARRKFLVLKRQVPGVWLSFLGMRRALTRPESSQQKFVRDTWDVFRVENLALEGFSNAVHK